MNTAFELSKQGEQVLLQYHDSEQQIPVRVVLVAPLTETRELLSIVDQNGQELELLHTFDCLSASTRSLLQAAIESRYFLPVIKIIKSIDIYSGDYYWDVDTDRGAKKFLLRSPETHLRRVAGRRLMLLDSQGLYYEIEDIRQLDKHSRALLERVL